MTIAEKVLRHLERDILFGHYKPGDRLVEREIAEKLGVSRVPVREALMNLERWGFVKPPLGNRKGREVVALTGREIEEFYQIILFIETSSFSECALVKNTELEEELWTLIHQMDDIAEREDLNEYRELNVKFHHTIVRWSQNRRLYRLYCDISKMERWFQNLTLYVPRMKQSNTEHRKIMGAYKDQDLLQIRTLFKEHYGHAIEILRTRGASGDGEAAGLDLPGDPGPVRNGR